ncbi:hypothetical protein vBCbaSRXM_120 [Citromicrobium phage vB_CbaS-RXM]|nr:hypothetical protein vBCbaSRXM_120 [Citromicrobium phage vB_CbaS-RXM]
MKTHTRSQFLVLMRALLDDMEQDHEDCTGVTETDEMPFEEWQAELTTCYENTVA